MAAPVFHSGRFATAYVGTTTANVEQPITSWTVNESTETQRFRNSRTGRFTVAEQTFVNAGFSLVCDKDFANNPFLTANGGLSIIAGVTNAAKLYIGGNSTPTNAAFWDFPQSILSSTTDTVTVDGKPGLSYNFDGSGVFVEPAT